MSAVIDAATLARELLDARASGAPVDVPPSAREGGFTLDVAYAVEAELIRIRGERGHRTVGRKVGYANKAMWRVLKLQTLVWAPIYDDSVQHARDGATLSIARMIAPRIEPEVIFTMKSEPAGSDLASVVAAVESVALGFEIVDCPFPDWKFQPADFVASFGLHAALIVGEARPLAADDADRLAALTVHLSRNDEHVEDGYGKNALRSPVLCLAELTAAVAARPGIQPFTAGELISTGSMTAAHPIRSGERWQAVSDADLLAGVTLEVL